LTAANAQTKLSERLTGGLEKLLADQTVTLWVGANDLVAESCRQFLELRKIAVPGRIALVGFDDSEVAWANRISSYNFNCPELARVMVAGLLRSPESLLGTRGRGPCFVEGFLNERDTTIAQPSKHNRR
jgi:DNA-binding LacI/PurR family transcriptional regulator